MTRKSVFTAIFAALLGMHMMSGVAQALAPEPPTPEPIPWPDDDGDDEPPMEPPEKLCQQFPRICGGKEPTQPH